LKHSFKELFKKLKIKNNEYLMIHADTSFFFQFSKQNNQKIIEMFIQSLIKYKKNLKIFIPTFTYTFCQKKKFDIIKTPSEVGRFSEACLKLSKFKRTMNPIFSFATFNFEKEMRLINNETCFGKNSIFDYFQKKKGKIVVLGCSFEKSVTFIHHIEELQNVKYRFYKNFHGTLKNKGGINKKISIKYFVRKKKLNMKIKNKKLSSFYKNFNFGRHSVYYTISDDLQKKCLKELNKDDNFLVQ
tara:strand:- start:621 stop:1349 length:729 start_codon:yes stop_codon:yes gene_type:complete